VTWLDEEPLVLLPPDWSQRVSLTRSWLTTVTKSKSDFEQRTGLKSTVLRGIKYSVANLTPRESSYLLRKLKFGLGQLLAVPIWTEVVHLTADVDKWGTVLPVTSTVDREFTDGGLIVLYRGVATSTFEVRRIDSLSANSITVTCGVVSDWPLGAEVYPLLSSRLPSSGDVVWKTTRFNTGNVDVVESILSEVDIQSWQTHIYDEDWTGGSWDVGPPYRLIVYSSVTLTADGTWASGWRPSKCRIYFTGASSASVTLVAHSLVYPYPEFTLVSVTGLPSGQSFDIEYSQDVDIHKMTLSFGAIVDVTDIQFLGSL
jgi:hypothetical protein